jgi:1-acyl-sn-glycerol-3-phosphate acyltransferase
MAAVAILVGMNEIASTNGTYHTTPRRVGWFARQFPSLNFHWQFVGIVFRAAFQAKRGLYNDAEWAYSSHKIVHALESVGVQIEVTGLNYVREVEGPCLVIGNHMSSLETTVLPGFIRPIKPVTFVVKRSLMTYPIFGHVMRSRDPVSVSQADVRADFKAMMDGGQERLARGVSIIIFPEGRRMEQFTPERFNSIGVKLAARAGVPIVPVALLTDAWGIGKPIGDFGRIRPQRKVRFAFGPPIQITGRGTEEQQQILDFIRQKLDQWAAEDA